MSKSLNTKDSNRFNEMCHVVSVYAEEPDHVLQRRFTRLHLYNLYDKHKRLVDLDKKISIIERNMALPNADMHQSIATDEGLEKLDNLLSEIDKALKDFGKPT
jgi:hypothetical protein